MNIKVILLIFLISFSGLSSVQGLNGQIIRKPIVIYANEKSLPGDQNIFWSENKNDTQLITSLNGMNFNDWESKEILIQDSLKSSPTTLDPINHIRYGIKLTQHFNYPIVHSSPTSSIYYKNHNFYFGPEYTFLLTKSFKDSTDDWEPEPWGFNLGYRFIVKSEKKKTNLFLQMNFSFYRVTYKEYQPGSTVLTDQMKSIIENTGAIGINYRFNKYFELFGGIGIGTTCGFFLLLQKVIPHSFVGIGYTIN